MLAQLLKHSDVHADAAVLEVGCGTANYLAALQEITGCQAVGVDPSTQMLAQARAQALQAQFWQATAEDMPFLDATFDFIFSVDVIHHVQDRAVYFREAARLLRPGGRFCTVTDSAEDIRQRQPLSSHFPETVPLELARYPRIAELETLLRAAGFRQIYVENVVHEYLLTDIRPFQEKAYSALHFISEEAFQRGLRRLQTELGKGPI
ncbi:MAG: class I SAM-dependent methyltransferase, partial [Caldilineae bacterium]